MISMGKQYAKHEKRAMNGAMRLSLAIGFLMLLMKTYAFWLTGSTAILSDAAESVVHVFAVGFAAYSMWLSHQPADKDHTYGHDRIAFFSAGFEGALIIIAAIFILYQSTQKLLCGFELENLDSGMVFVSVATLLNGGLGLFLVKQGRRYSSLVLEADGKHILTDCITSLGVLLALIFTRVTGWIYFDPIIALLIGVNILWTGGRLLYSCFQGLMDRADPELEPQLRAFLKRECENQTMHFHHLRYRDTGNRLMVEVHLLFPFEMPIAKAHELATCLELKMEKAFKKPTELVSHLEPFEGHDEVHNRLLGREG